MSWNITPNSRIAILRPSPALTPIQSKSYILAFWATYHSFLFFKNLVRKVGDFSRYQDRGCNTTNSRANNYYLFDLVVSKHSAKGLKNNVSPSREELSQRAVVEVSRCPLFAAHWENFLTQASVGHFSALSCFVAVLIRARSVCNKHTRECAPLQQT